MCVRVCACVCVEVCVCVRERECVSVCLEVFVTVCVCSDVWGGGRAGMLYGWAFKPGGVRACTL